jgi:lipopolysaccharide transport system permease protein
MSDKNAKASGYEVVIRPNRGWFHIDWEGIFYYRDLLFLFVRRDFVARYKQTILGPLWFVIQPITTTVVFTIVFSQVAKIPTDNLPPMLFYLCGIMIWNYFTNCVESSSVSLIKNAGLLEKVYFPRLIMPLSNIISNLFAFAIQAATFVAFYLYFLCATPAKSHIHLNLFILLLPLLLIGAAAFSLGVGLWVSALTAKYRDLSFLMTFLLQLWLYATPVIYPVSAIPEHWRFILAINPMAAIVDLFRYAFFGTPALSLKYLAASFITTFVVLISGVLVFNKVEKTFVDTV